MIGKQEERYRATKSFKYLLNTVWHGETMNENDTDKDIATRLCELCTENTWDVYLELEDNRMCGNCYTYIYKREIAPRDRL